MSVQPKVCKAYQGGGGGISAGDEFVRGKFRHTFNFGAGPSDTGNFNIPNPWLLVDNELCDPLVGPHFEHYQLTRDTKTTSRPRLALQTEGGTSSTEDAQRAGSAPDCGAKFCGETCRQRTEERKFAKTSSPNDPPPPTPPPACKCCGSQTPKSVIRGCTSTVATGLSCVPPVRLRCVPAADPHEANNVGSTIMRPHASGCLLQWVHLRGLTCRSEAWGRQRAARAHAPGEAHVPLPPPPPPKLSEVGAPCASQRQNACIAAHAAPHSLQVCRMFCLGMGHSFGGQDTVIWGRIFILRQKTIIWENYSWIWRWCTFIGDGAYLQCTCSYTGNAHIYLGSLHVYWGGGGNFVGDFRL